MVAGDDSSGMLGHLERTFYNSGRHLYTVLFKAIFSGMKLTQRWRGPSQTDLWHKLPRWSHGFT